MLPEVSSAVSIREMVKLPYPATRDGVLDRLERDRIIYPARQRTRRHRFWRNPVRQKNLRAPQNPSVELNCFTFLFRHKPHAALCPSSKPAVGRAKSPSAGCRSGGRVPAGETAGLNFGPERADTPRNRPYLKRIMVRFEPLMLMISAREGVGRDSHRLVSRPVP